jgi:hypothetical protein
MARMKTQAVTTQSILRKINSAGRSSLYRWLAENHDGIAEAASRGRVLGWSELARDFAAPGLLDGSGKPPSTQSARKTWSRVKADIARARAEKAAAAPSPLAHRSRPRSDWQPPVSAPSHPVGRREPPPYVPPTTEALSADQPKKGAHDDLPPEVKAKFDRLRADFAETDRRRFGSWGGGG